MILFKATIKNVQDVFPDME